MDEPKPIYIALGGLPHNLTLGSIEDYLHQEHTDPGRIELFHQSDDNSNASPVDAEIDIKDFSSSLTVEELIRYLNEKYQVAQIDINYKSERPYTKKDIIYQSYELVILLDELPGDLEMGNLESYLDVKFPGYGNFIITSKLGNDNALELLAKDFPNDLKLENLIEYIEEHYPEVNNFSIIYNPIEIYNELPPELLAKITKLNVNKASVTPVRKEIYENECYKEIKPEEIAKEIKNTKNVVMQLDNSNILIGPRWGTYEEFEFGHRTGIIEYGFFFDERYLISMMNDFGNEIVLENYIDEGHEHVYGSLINSLSNVNIDMFTAYRIRLNRISCMNYNIRYADTILVNLYNDMFAEDFTSDTLITEDDIIFLFLANCLANMINKSVTIIKEKFDLNHLNDSHLNDYLNKIQSKFIEIRNVIKYEVMKLTHRVVEFPPGNFIYLSGAMSDKSNPNKLYLPAT